MDEIYFMETDEEDGFEWGFEEEEPELIEEGPLYDKTVTIVGYRGIAFRVDGYREGMIECHMVGDDRTFTFDVDEATEIDEDEFCHGCGQIGCGW
jgi:hypothetical protein